MCDQDIELRRKRDLERYHRRTAERREKGLCLKCGKRPPEPHRSQCGPCIEKRRTADLARYHQRTAERVAQGLCPKCGKRPPEPERSQCGPCLEKDAAAGRARAAGMPRRDPEKRNAAARRLYAKRRAKGLCTDCGEPSQGAARCEPCARRSHERSIYFRGMPLYPPQYTVIELDTGDDHGTFDSWEDVALCLAFAQLSLDQVEVITDQSPVATWAAWE